MLERWVVFLYPVLSAEKNNNLQFPVSQETNIYRPTLKDNFLKIFYSYLFKISSSKC